MQIQVHYMAQIRQAAGNSAEIVRLHTNATLSELLLAITTKHGDSIRQFLLDGNGLPRQTLLVFVNDDQTLPMSPEPLQDGDHVTLLSPIAGGS